jgi:hypothetical protein
MGLPKRCTVNLPTPERAKFGVYLLPFLEAQAKERQRDAARATNEKRNRGITRTQLIPETSSGDVNDASKPEPQKRLAIYQAAEMAGMREGSVREAKKGLPSMGAADQSTWARIPTSFSSGFRYLRVNLRSNPKEHQVAELLPAIQPGFFWVAVFSNAILETFDAPIHQAQVVGALARLEFSLNGSLGFSHTSELRDTNVYLQPFTKVARESSVYFISAEGSGRIKIGWTDNFEARHKQIQTSSPFPLRVLLNISGDVKRERELHEKFSHLRRHMEWFEAAPELLNYIEHLKRGG